MKRTLSISFVFISIALMMIQCSVFWTSPKSYSPAKPVVSQPSIMSLDEYTNSGLIDTHARPYTYVVQNKNGKGAVLVFGLDHTNDPSNNQLAEIEKQWAQFNPTVAMVEGRLGFLFSWLQNPVRKLGEGGLTAKLAKSDKVKLYSWEPARDSEIEILLQKFDPVHMAAFYCLRPYRGNYDGLTRDEANRVMQQLIKERTNHRGINGYLKSVEQIDSLWKKYYPKLEDWRKYKHPKNGWPEGTFKQLAEATNSIRDVHMCNSIVELVNKGERVFITMGASHAPRIERALKENLN